MPGPACYGRGGTEATVTDANLVLGRLAPDRFLGGELTLDAKAAHAAVDRLAGPLGFTGPDAGLRMAEGILSIATVIMAGAIKQVSIAHGLDPREFALFCYGGGGPLHASALARELSIPLVIVPPEPGNFSALGMLLADARLDLSKTFIGVLSGASVTTLTDGFAEMETEARAALQKDFGAADISFEHRAEMRYVGQRHNITVPISLHDGVDGLRASFERDYTRRYGHADTRAQPEFQALHLSAFARMRRPALEHLPRAAMDAGAADTRQVHFGDGFAATAVYQRDALAPGFSADGPALIEEYGSTTLVWPGDRFTIGALREIRIDCAVQ